MRQHAEAQRGDEAGAGGGYALHLLAVGVFDSLGEQFRQHPRIGHTDRQDAGDRPQPHRADEHQRPDRLVQPAHAIEHPAGEEAEHPGGDDIPGAEEPKRKRNEQRQHAAQIRHRHCLQHRPQQLGVVPAGETGPVHHQADDDPQPLQAAENLAEFEQPVEVDQVYHRQQPDPPTDRQGPAIQAEGPGGAQALRRDFVGGHANCPMKRCRMRSDVRSRITTTSRIRMQMALTSS